MPYEKKARGTRLVAVQCAIGTLIPTVDLNTRQIQGDAIEL